MIELSLAEMGPVEPTMVIGVNYESACATMYSETSSCVSIKLIGILNSVKDAVACGMKGSALER